MNAGRQETALEFLLSDAQSEGLAEVCNLAKSYCEYMIPDADDRKIPGPRECMRTRTFEGLARLNMTPQSVLQP